VKAILAMVCIEPRRKANVGELLRGERGTRKTLARSSEYASLIAMRQLSFSMEA
jgi:hypothetical protein